jgi:hypothetical protein
MLRFAISVLLLAAFGVSVLTAGGCVTVSKEPPPEKVEVDVNKDKS